VTIIEPVLTMSGKNTARLLDEIINAAVDDQQTLSVVLRKCLLLAHELKNEQLKGWANNELNGYNGSDNLPDYRIVEANAKGNFSGPFHAELRHYPIPAILLEEGHRHWAEKVHLGQAISAYQNAVSPADNNNLMYEWPSNLCLYYQSKLSNRGFVLVNAWLEVPKNVFVELLDTVRNRVLNMALELKTELGESLEIGQVTPAQVAKANETISQNIFMGPSYFAANNSQVNVHNVSQHITVGNRDELDAVLATAGLNALDLKELSKAIEADKNTLGSRIGSWIKDHGPKVVAGGVKLTAEVGRTLLTEWLKQYFGLSQLGN
jgi:hypothetical protein